MVSIEFQNGDLTSLAELLEQEPCEFVAIGEALFEKRKRLRVDSTRPSGPRK